LIDPVKNEFNVLYDAFFDEVSQYIIFRTNNLLDAEDIVQETFAELYKVLNKRGIFYVKNAKAFLLRIAKFKLFRHYSFKKSIQNNLERIKLSHSTLENVNEFEWEVEKQFFNVVTMNNVWQMLQKKDLITQKIFVLYYYSGLTLKQIAQNLKLGESCVKHKLYNTLIELRSNMSKGEI